MACYVLTFDGIADKIRIPSSSDTFNFETFSKDLQALAEQEKFELTELKQEAVTTAKIPTSEDVLFYSGGAIGADTFWGQIAKEYGYNTRHIYAPEYDSWSPEKRAEIDKQYDDATNKLGRWKKASTTYEGKLMRRGMEQANLADSIFAIGTINSDQYRVDGGTAYAVVRGIERNIPIYLYDLLNKRWKTYDANKGIFVPYDQTPLLTPHAALIGSRMKEQLEYQQQAKAVIRQVFEKFVSEKSYLQKASSTNQGGNVKPKTINVWFRTNENADLSNFAARPFKYQGKSFGNVETAFQLSKLRYAAPLEQQPTDVQNWANGNLQSCIASDSRKLGRKIVGLRTSDWDANSSRIMEEIIRTSLEQNPNILQKLKDTGDAIITHTQGDAPWNTEFPRILMKIRNESIGTKTSTVSVDTSHNLVIVGASNVSATAKQMNGIDTLRHPDTNEMHFGNPFSHTNDSGVQKVFPTVKEAVIAFEQWLRGENYQDIEPERREWIAQQINSGALVGKPLVYYTDRVPDNSYGRSTYDYNVAPNHAHILMKLIQEHVHPEQKATSQVIRQEGHGAIDDSINALENNTLLSDQEKKSVKSLIGDKTPKVVMASEHSDPVFHAKKIKELVEAELAKPIQDRSFHMMQIMTKHDGLPLRELAKLPIPKLFHFSITSLGGTPYEPGVMKMDHLLDRIGALINDGTLNPSLITIRIDPIVPGVTKKEDIRHIVERGLAMGIKQYKFSVMDSYGYTSTGERCETEKDRYIIKRMQDLGYDWDTYYGRKADGTVNFNAKPEYINDIFHYMDDLADELHFFISTCGEDIKHISGLKHIKAVGCLNVAAMNAAMGTNDIVHVDNEQRSTCSCYGGKVDVLRYDDNCASSCLYCYAKHNSDQAMRYYNEDGSLKINRFTEVTEPERLVRIPGIGTEYMLEGYSKTNPSYTFQQFREDLSAVNSLYAQWNEANKTGDFTSYAKNRGNQNCIQRLGEWYNSLKRSETTREELSVLIKEPVDSIEDLIEDLLWDLDPYDEDLIPELFEFSHVDPLQLQFDFDSSDSLVKRPALTQKSPEMQTVKTVSSYSSSETVNKINRYLDAALSLQSNEKSISELDTQEAIHVVAQQLDRLGIPTHLVENDAEMEKLGLPANTEAAVKNGEIYVNLQRASVSSPMHEFMHLVFAVMKQTNFDTFVSLMNDLRGITEFDSILQQVQSSEYYNKLIESDQMEEAFVRYLSGLLEGKISTSDTFETWYNNNSQQLNKAIQTTFNTPPIVDLLTFLKQPFASLTKYGSELFGQKNNKTEGYSKQKYQVDISGRIMDYIQTNMNSLIQEGECK